MKSLLSILTWLMLGTCITGCFGPPEEVVQDQRARGALDQDPSINLKTLAVGDFSLHYAEAGEPGRATVVFLHGTPGSWRSLGRLMTRAELREAARLVSIDRPGWGGSLLKEQRSEPDFAEQSRLIAPLLRQLKAESPGQPLILAGHSYGGSLAAFLAYAHPPLVDGVLMAASAIDPQLGKPRWYNYAASVWPISSFIDERLRMANDEIWGVASALKTLEPWWQTAAIPLIFVQGEEDELVHPRNLDFAEERLPRPFATVIRLPKQNHFLHVNGRDLLAELILELLAQAEEPSR